MIVDAFYGYSLADSSGPVWGSNYTNATATSANGLHYQLPACGAVLPSGQTLLISGVSTFDAPSNTYSSVLLAADASTGQVVWTERTPAGSGVIRSMRVTPDGRRLIHITFNGAVSSLNTANGQLVWTRAVFDTNIVSNPGASLRLSLTDDGSTIIAANLADDGAIASLDVTSGSVHWQTPLPSTASAATNLVLDMGLNAVLVANSSNLIALDIKSGTVLGETPYLIESGATAAGFSPLIAVASNQHIAYVQVMLTVAGTLGDNYIVMYAFDLKALVAGNSNALIGLYDWARQADQWSNNIVVDSTGLRVYSMILGPNPQPTPSDPSAIELSILTLQPGAHSFVANKPVVSEQNTSGFPILAIGPSPGQLTVACGATTLVFADQCVASSAVS